jgi:hypothetical protein
METRCTLRCTYAVLREWAVLFRSSAARHVMGAAIERRRGATSIAAFLALVIVPCCIICCTESVVSVNPGVKRSPKLPPTWHHASNTTAHLFIALLQSQHL